MNVTSGIKNACNASQWAVDAVPLAILAGMIHKQWGDRAVPQAMSAFKRSHALLDLIMLIRHLDTRPGA